jgi:Fur family peroxide stress response transcriptional regulator
MKDNTIIDILLRNKLKVTPQRIAVLEAAYRLNNHPTAENIIDFIKKNHSHIAAGTIYKTLELFSEKGIIKKMLTESDVMRYDPVDKKHFHLYCAESDRIEDFYDNDLNVILDNYLAKKVIPNFKIKDIKVQLVGQFTDATSGSKPKND